MTRNRLPSLALAATLLGTLASGASYAATATDIINLDGKLESASCIASFDTDVISFDDFVLGSNADTTSNVWNLSNTSMSTNKAVTFIVSCPNGGNDVTLSPPTGDGDATLQPLQYFEDSNGVKIGFVIRNGRYLKQSPATSNSGSNNSPGGYKQFVNQYSSLFYGDSGTKGIDFKPGETYSNLLWIMIGRNNAKQTGSFSHTFTFQLNY